MYIGLWGLMGFIQGSELADIIMRHLSIIFLGNLERSQLTGSLQMSQFLRRARKKTANYRLVSLTSVSGRIMETVILGVIEKHLEVQSLNS